MDIRKLKPPSSRPFADPKKLKNLGKFDWFEYAPIEVFRNANGTYTIQSGMTRWTRALQEGIFDLPVNIINP